jgi:hypothetical protein
VFRLSILYFWLFYSLYQWHMSLCWRTDVTLCHTVFIYSPASNEITEVGEDNSWVPHNTALLLRTTSFFFNGSTALWGHRPPHFSRFHDHTLDTPHSVGLLWSSDQPVAENSTWQHTTLKRDIHVPGRIRTHNPSKRAAEDPRLRPHGHWDRLRTPS